MKLHIRSDIFMQEMKVMLTRQSMQHLKARRPWANMSWENRANIFLKAADLIAGKYRPYMNGTTMLGQSKNAYQAEIDSACELIDFLRFNVHFLSEIYQAATHQ